MLTRAVRYRADVEERAEEAAPASYTSSGMLGSGSEGGGTHV